MSDTAPFSENTVPFYATGRRSRDLAKELDLSEAGLLARHDGPEVVRLRPEMAAILEALPALGEVMALTRNEAAVHEIVGTFGGISISGAMGLVVHPPLDLRLFLKHWHHAYALELPDEKGPRRSIQIFDAAGEAVIKIHLRPASDAAAFASLVERFRAPAGEEPPAFEPYDDTRPAEPSAEEAEAFRTAFAGMADVHEFVPLLRRHGLDRRGALPLMGEANVRALAPGAARAVLEGAAEEKLPIMVFVGNRGCIQIHTGPVERIKAMGPWINVLDPGFDLHLREDLIAEAFAVRKPTAHGHLTSIELYDAAGTLILQFFGVRERAAPEDERWRALVADLPAAERVAAE
ncbi:hemin-degrading factor [Aureimonas mangrovi]|uniref:hemin-degrading factor n=1 Tax=Aureimonas mangrovi TaxID=2758041 RepID=UPI00163DA54F|nr:ChuX/HutX family heme-like substrate-binding protein [Aureimonas mangrovi]